MPCSLVSPALKRITLFIVLSGGVLTIRAETAMSEIAQVLANKRVSGLPVVDDYMNLLGIVSEKDVLASLYAPNWDGPGGPRPHDGGCRQLQHPRQSL